MKAETYRFFVPGSYGCWRYIFRGVCTLDAASLIASALSRANNSIRVMYRAGGKPHFRGGVKPC